MTEHPRCKDKNYFLRRTRPANNNPPSNIIQGDPAPPLDEPPLDVVPLDEDELLLEDEELLLAAFPDDELLEEELLDELLEDELLDDELTPVFTKIPLSVPLSVFLVTVMVRLPSDTAVLIGAGVYATS